LGAQKTISSYSFDQIVLIFGYIVEHIFLQFPSWTQIMTSSNCWMFTTWMVSVQPTL